LSRLFLEATEGLGNVSYIYGDSVKSVEQTDKNISVTFTIGSKDIFDLLVAADGSTSKTRSLILDEQILKDSYKFLGQYIAFFRIPNRPSDPKLWQWYNAPKDLSIMIRPHRSTSTMGAYLCITMPTRGKRDPAVEDAMGNGMEDTKRMLHKYFGNASWEAKRVLEGMDHAEDFYMSRTALVKLPKWANGCALVIGDAAFATVGVGTSLAIESAYMLAGELSKIKSSHGVPQALMKYKEVFRPLYAKMEELPPGFHKLHFHRLLGAFDYETLHYGL
jgi:2-polyprenyl-6-methoxyphenol hydroxylase-like FAD-dependent oxidoreductase